MTDNRINKMFDNDFNRVVERARRNGAEPSVWQVIDTHDWSVTYTNDTTYYEALNARKWHGVYLFSPIFWPDSGVDLNGNLPSS